MPNEMKIEGEDPGSMVAATNETPGEKAASEAEYYKKLAQKTGNFKMNQVAGGKKRKKSKRRKYTKKSKRKKSKKRKYSKRRR